MYKQRCIQIADTKLTDEMPRLYQLFVTCLGSEQTFPRNELEHVHGELATKMFNLRKEDWRQSYRRVYLDKKGKTSTVTLNLGDELKPMAASK